MALVVASNGPASAPANAGQLLEANRAEPTVQLNYTGISFEEKDAPVRQLKFKETLDAAKLNIPARPKKFGMVGLRCDGIEQNGHLANCDVSVEPKGVGYEEAGQNLARALIVDKSLARSLVGVRFISVHAKLSNTAGVASDGPCWPPGCHWVPAPPPPPATLDDPEIREPMDAWEVRWRSVRQQSSKERGDARRAMEAAAGSAIGSDEWLAARGAVLRFFETRKRLDDLYIELLKFRAKVYPSASEHDQKLLAGKVDGSHKWLNSSDLRSTELLLELIGACPSAELSCNMYLRP